MNKPKICKIDGCDNKYSALGLCRNHYMREYLGRWEKTPKAKAYRRKYFKTPRGYLVRCYRSMRHRVMGITFSSRKYPHLWLGKSLLPKEEFLKWALNDPQFNYLFRNWTESGYEINLSPSIDRINSFKGYELGNIQWLTMLANSTKAGFVRKSRHKATDKQIVNSLVMTSLGEKKRA